MWLKEQITVEPHYVLPGRPGDTQGTEEDQGRDGGTVWIVL